MKKKRWLVFMVFLFPAVVALFAPSLAESAPAAVVGRVYHIEGDLLRYVPAENDWVAVVKDAPFGTGDTLFSGTQGMTELIVPNGAWIRTGFSTQIQFIALDVEVAEADVASGVARFYNKGDKTVIKATCPFGYVLAYPGSVFDFYVGENSAEIIAVKGKVSFVHSSTQAKYDVTAGSPSLLADQNQVASGEGVVDPTWDQWNGTREGFWAAKVKSRGRSVKYLPPALQDEAYVLEENGRWETVVYEGRERLFWRPVTVDAGWQPFTAGRWTEWYGDQTWVPSEPFGYMTHHYGNWVRVGHHWYWAPPVARVVASIPLLDIAFAWTPGRVGWIHSGPNVGWVPLAPAEPYYSHHHWGGRHDIVMTGRRHVEVNVRNYAYVNQAVVVNQNNFYNVNNYRNVRVTNINQTTIINNYKAAPVVNNTVINNYTTNKQKFNFTNVTVNNKPHNSVINRIKENEKAIPQARNVNARTLQQQVQKMPEGKINRGAKIDQPKSAEYIVPANQVNKPKAEIKLPQKEVKPTSRIGGAPGQPGQQTPPGKPGQPGQQVPPGKPGQPGQPGQVTTPSKPGQPGQLTPPGKPGQITPPGKPGQPAQPGQITPPGKPGQPAQPGQVTTPPKPGQPGQITPPSRPGQPTPPGKPGQPVQPGQVTTPSKPGQPAQPGQPSQPGQITPPSRPGQPTPPGKPGQPAQPGQSGQVTAPSKPGQPSQPGQITPPSRPGQPTPPGKPGQPAQPGQPGQVTAPSKPGQPGQITPPSRPGQPTPPGQVTTPPKPGQPAQPGQPSRPGQPAQPGHVTTPIKPGQPAQPGQPGQATAPSKPGQPGQPQAQPQQQPRSQPQAQPQAAQQQQREQQQQKAQQQREQQQQQQQQRQQQLQQQQREQQQKAQQQREQQQQQQQQRQQQLQQQREQQQKAQQLQQQQQREQQQRQQQAQREQQQKLQQQRAQQQQQQQQKAQQQQQQKAQQQQQPGQQQQPK